MASELNGKTVLVIGGSTGIGLSVAKHAVATGGKVVIAARDQDRLQNARVAIGSGIDAHQVDIASETSVKALFDQVGRIDHLAITGPGPGFGPFRNLQLDDVRADFDAKFWGQYRAAYFAVRSGLPEDGSITFMSGAYSTRPVPGASTLAAIQAGLEGLARGLAVDLSPIRVNAVSPGLTDTPLIRGLFGDAAAEDLYRQTDAQLPGKRIASADNIAELYLFLMTNRTMTGSALFPDSGYTLR
jgi:NAD(P)-dependent dehydrogenase (short-subunit alcohol dehydrogenase family)